MARQRIVDEVVQKSRCGRPRAFDEHDALGRATHLFRARGYDGVTIDALAEAMGVGKPSLYATFGNKPALFVRCLEAYGAELGAAAMPALLDPLRVADGIAGFLAHAVHNATSDSTALGCLIVCIAPLVDDPIVREFILRASSETERAVESRLRKAVQAGELPSGFPSKRRARLVVDVSRGLTMRARFGIAREELLRDAHDAVPALLG